MSDDVPVDSDVGSAFTRVAHAHPERIALIGVEQRLTCGEVHGRATAITAALDELSPSEAPVVVLAGDDLTAPLAMLGVAMAGRRYLVLDPDAPDDFLRGIATRHGTAVLLTDSSGRIAAQRLALDAPMIEVDSLPLTSARSSGDIDPGTALSVSTTSGSTGVPKSVLHSHRNVVHNALTYAGAIGATPDDRFLVVTPFSGVSAATPLYTALLTGAGLCVHPIPARGMDSLARLVDDEGVTVAHLPPSALPRLGAAAPRPLTGVRLATLGGDRLLPAQAAAARDLFPRAELLVRYNTSEANWIAGHRIAPDDPLPTGPVPIGIAVPWKRVRVVDPHGADVADGDVGELHVSSDHLALGYLDDIELTAARFVTHGGIRWYRTGDRVRRRDDGLLEFAGREDHVLKVRGVLVDLERVEQELMRLPGVEGAAVAAVSRNDSATELVALVVGPTPRPRALRAALRERLPAVMVPARIVAAEAVPLTGRGKVDRARVAEISAAAAIRGSGGEPLAPRERAVVESMQTVLEVEGLGRDDDLFDLGADSLDVAELCTRLSDALGLEVGVPLLVSHPTAASLVAALSAGATPQHLLPVAGGDGIPVVLLSGGGGGHVDGMALLARAVGGHPAYAAVPRGFDGSGRGDRTIVARAAHVADDMEAAGLAGVAALVGHSSGGTVAIEAARELERRGHQTPVVVLLDTLALTDATRERRSFWPNLRWEVRTNEQDRAARGQGTSWARRAWWAGRYSRRRVVRQVTAAVAAVRPAWVRDDNGAWQEAVKVALRRHSDTAYAGRVHLVRAAESWYLPKGADDDLNWSEVLGREIEVTVVPGDHESVLRAAHLPTTAAAVRAALDGVAGRVG